VEIRLGEQTTVGIHAGINEQGALRLAVDGGIRTFHAGEVSLRAVEQG
jgi:biotin-(acetyl-CoA carboxylase) ligase